MMARLYPSVVERYFSKYYMTDIMGKLCEDQCVLQHSNRICVVTVAPSHKLFQGGPVVNVNFNSGKKHDRLENKVSGKSKKGAQFLEPSSVLCEVTCLNGSKYTLRSCVKGKLVEVNEELVSKPELISLKPQTEGYIAVVLPKLQPLNMICQHLLNEEQYQEALRKRRENGVSENPTFENLN